MAVREITIERLERRDIDRRLREFERAHLKATGEALDSSEFFRRFKSGEFDTRFGMKWAAMCRAAERLA